jgi:tetratricopeptide (TPR) repeat protein
MKRIFYILIFLSAVSVADLSAQIDRREVRKGNREFKKENYKEADIEYRKALVKDSLSMAANYNLAGNLFRQEEFEQASKVLDRIKEVAPSSEYAADYYYNAGDVAIASKDWQAAVDALKQSLLRNPGDLDAKENYIYAKKMLENQQQQQQNQNQNQNQDQNQQDQNKDQNQDQNQDKQDQNQDQNKDQNQDKQDQNQDQNKDQNQDKQDQNQNQQQQGQQPKITPQAAQQMLQAIQAKEKETQDKVNKEKAKALNSRQKEKNW